MVAYVFLTLGCAAAALLFFCMGVLVAWQIARSVYEKKSQEQVEHARESESYRLAVIQSRIERIIDFLKKMLTKKPKEQSDTVNTIIGIAGGKDTEKKQAQSSDEQKGVN